MVFFIEPRGPSVGSTNIYLQNCSQIYGSSSEKSIHIYRQNTIPKPSICMPPSKLPRNPHKILLPMCLPLRFFVACHEHKLRMVTWTCCASYECKSDCYKILIQQKWRMTGKTLRPWGYRSSCLERGLQATASNGRRLCSPCGSNFGHAQEVVWKISGKVPTTCNGVVQIVTPLWQSWPWNVQVYKWLQDNYTQISSYSTDAYEHQAVCIIYHKQALSYMRAAIWALHKSKNLFVFWFGGGYGCKFNLLCHSDRPSSVLLVLAHLSLIITWKLYFNG